MTRQIQIQDLGCLEYKQALAKQLDYHAQVVSRDRPAVVLLVEHPRVVTLGKSANTEYLQNSLAAAGIPVVQTDRGGEVTAHMPGQLVVYPIIPVQEWGLSPKRYVELLEEVVIDLLRKYNINGVRDAINPGIWIGSDKVCALGIRIKQRVAMHGLALNVATDLAVFDHIVPCGIRGRGVTQMADHCQVTCNLSEVKQDLVESFKLIFSAES